MPLHADALANVAGPTPPVQGANAPLPGLGGEPLPFEAGPPKTPEDLETRKQGWRGFMQRLSTDKSLQQMFLTMGTQLMQPTQPGQTGLGQLGSAIQAGDVARRSQLALEGTSAFKNKELAIKQQTADAATKAAGAKGKKLPSSEVQVLELLSQAKVKEAAVKGETLSPETALLEAEKDRRTKGPAELLSTILPFLALIPDAKERAAMTQRAIESLAKLQAQPGADANVGIGTGNTIKRQVWDEKQGKFVEQ